MVQSPASLHFTHPPLLPIYQSTSNFHFIHSEHGWLQCIMKCLNWFHTCDWTLRNYWTVHPSHIHLATDLWYSSVGERAPYWQVKQEWHEPQSTTTQHHHNAVKQHGQISSQEHHVLTKEKHEITQWGSTAHRIYRVSHELRSLLRESVPYVKIYRYNPKHLCVK
jgi:hypothetical protein